MKRIAKVMMLLLFISAGAAAASQHEVNLLVSYMHKKGADPQKDFDKKIGRVNYTLNFRKGDVPYTIYLVESPKARVLDFYIGERDSVDRWVVYDDNLDGKPDYGALDRPGSESKFFSRRLHQMENEQFWQQEFDEAVHDTLEHFGLLKPASKTPSAKRTTKRSGPPRSRAF